MDKTPQEQRAAELRRLNINHLIDEYRRAHNLGMGDPPLHPLVREKMIRAILDKEFGAHEDT